MTIRYHKGDLPDLKAYETASAVAVDSETLGLNPHRDRLCVVQLSPGDGSAMWSRSHAARAKRQTSLR